MERFACCIDWSRTVRAVVIGNRILIEGTLFEHQAINLFTGFGRQAGRGVNPGLFAHSQGTRGNALIPVEFLVSCLTLVAGLLWLTMGTYLCREYIWRLGLPDGFFICQNKTHNVVKNRRGTGDTRHHPTVHACIVIIADPSCD